VTEREGDHALLELRPNLVRHPQPPALPDLQRLETPLSTFAFPP